MRSITDHAHDSDNPAIALQGFYPECPEEFADPKQPLLKEASTVGAEFVAVMLLQTVMDEADQLRFSFDKALLVEYRIDGTWYEIAPPPEQMVKEVHQNLSEMFMLSSDELSSQSNTRIPVLLDGLECRIPLKLEFTKSGGREVFLISNTEVPTPFAEASFSG